MPRSSTPSSKPATADPAPERIAKWMSRAGLCSRREAERWIADGRVAVDGKILETPATLVTEASRITVDDRPVGRPEGRRVWRYHKPRGLICTHDDPQGRPTLFAALPPSLPRVVSVGRLDINSEGLLLLTNDGGLAGQLERGNWTRRYRVRAYGAVDEKKLAGLAKGATIDGVRYGPIEARLDTVKGGNAWLTLGLKEGKNREIKRVLENIGLSVNRLIRTAYGPFQLGALAPGAVEEIPAKTIDEQLGRADRRR